MSAVAKDWLTANELLGLPNMPADKRGVHRKALASGWQYREVAGNGGTRREYHVASLPATTRAALSWHTTAVLAGNAGQALQAAAQVGTVEGAKAALKSNLSTHVADTAKAEGLRNLAAMPANEQRRMDARLQVLQAFEAFQQASGVAMTVAEHQFSSAYRLGHVAVEPWVRALVGTVAPASIQRWRLAVRKGGITALAGAYGNRKGASKIDAQPQMREFVQAMLVRFPESRATQIMHGLRTRLAGDIAGGSIELPSMRSLERWMETWREKNAQTLMALSNPDAWKNKFMVAFGSQSEGVTGINQRWELDSTPADVMLTDGRHAVLGVVDVFTRRAKLLVSKTSKSTAVTQVLRDALLDWGVPALIKTDNGSDYKSKHVGYVAANLDIKQEFCPPFQPWHKPHIERFFGTFARGMLELLPNFIGHNVAERSAIESRTSFADRLMKRGEVVPINMSAAEFQLFCNQWVDGMYMHEPHEGLQSRTPFAVASANREQVRIIKDERVLDVLLAEAAGSQGGYLTVQKKGLKSDGAWFIAPELEAWVGQRVMARQLPDLGQIVVYGGDNRLICIAECPERTGMDRKEVAAKGRELQKKRVQEERAALKAAAKRQNVDGIVHEILLDRAQQAGKLAMLPKQTVEHTSTGLQGAANALAEITREPGTSAELLRLEGVSSAWQRLQAEQAINDIPEGNDNELARRRAEVQPVFNTPHERAQWIEKRSRVRALTDEERDYMARFKKDNLASYRRIVELVDDMTNDMSSAQKETPDASASGAS
ncbi:DNA-binding protein [Polaromonas sp. JS666]|uniref:DNA-binding protein n=1 Tax=Polaromonas sp. (strain JS666 / ATCC BAA-500) TaxID=296591 RepID=UPI0000464B56|nr:DNA-binding protein [Polaromonas sp. JS666]ABE45651.1 Integrase, catalytic region [Polaromonas sp. JS666]